MAVCHNRLHHELMRFSEKLTWLIEDRGISQATLADRVEVSESTLSRWCSGSRTPDMYQAAKIAACFAVPLSYLVDDQADQPPRQLTVGDDAVLEAFHTSGFSVAQAVRALTPADRQPGKGPIVVRDQVAGILGQQQAANRRSPAKAKRDQEAPKG